MKGQAEIIGLVLIVVLISIGFLLYVKFSFSADSPDARASFQESQMGQTFLNSMQKTTLECGSRQFVMKDLLERIAAGQTTPNCNAEQVVRDSFSSALDNSMRVWGINYRLRFQRAGNNADPEPLDALTLGDIVNPDVPEREQCGDDKNRKADRVLIPVGVTRTNVVLLLERCD